MKRKGIREVEQSIRNPQSAVRNSQSAIRNSQSAIHNSAPSAIRARHRHDQKLELILRTSARIFAKKSYHSTSMRDISRGTGVSLAGLYHYCRSKEQLLFLIQDNCFGRVLERLEERLKAATDPAEKLHIFIGNHLNFFAANMAEMKVLSHESGSLAGKMHARVAGKKQKYTEVARSILAELQAEQALNNTIDLTVATYALFGTMNWIYNWYDPRGKLKVGELVDNVFQLFLNGFVGHSSVRQSSSQNKSEFLSVWQEFRPGSEFLSSPE